MRLRPAVIVLCAGALAGPAAAATTSSARPPAAAATTSSARPAIRLARPLPSIARIDDTVTVAGRLTAAPRRPTWVVLQGLRAPPWRTLARVRPGHGGRFVIDWHLGSGTPTGPLQLRVVDLAGDRVVAATRAVTVAVGSAATSCAPPSPPPLNIPDGDGWIVGGVYDEGGPAPGMDQCASSAYTITATPSNGGAAFTQNVAGGQSYTLVVPAGSYALSSGPCRGQATVTAGQQTTANTVCAFP